MKNNKNGKILNVLLGVIAIFIIIFVIAWIVNRGGNSTDNKAMFEENLNNMQETAKEYFVNDLPADVGDSNIISLEEMYTLDLIEPLKYGKVDCDVASSYISITKINEREYKIKSNLVCGDKKDSVTEKIESKIEVKDSEGNIIVDKDDENVTIEKETKTGSKSKSTVKTETKCLDFNCPIVELPTVCDLTTEYEFVKRSVSCPYGYTMANGTCVKTSTESIPATPKYSDPYTAHEAAKEKTGDTYVVYADPIVTKGKTTYYCTEGTLSGDKCILTENKNSSTSCPSGYTRDGDYCYKYANKQPGTTTYSCPSGYTSSGSGSSMTCYKKTNKTGGTTTYSCPSGYTSSGSGSSMTCYKKTNKSSGSTTYSCPSGYTSSGSGSSMTCYKKQNATVNTSCPTGYSPSGSQCVKTSTPNKTYTAWGNPVSTYQTTTKESTYTYDLEKKVLVGTGTKAGITVYTYSIYKRSYSYTCATGQLSGSKCYSYANATTTYSCPSSYKRDGSVCYLYTDPVKNTTSGSCPSGYAEKSGYCYLYADPVKNTTAGSCPSGYNEKNGYCYLYTNPTSKTGAATCPSGYTDNGSNCYIRTNVTTAYSCPSGYTDNGTNCKKTVNASKNTTPDTYSCPSGYHQSGSGASTKCSQTRQNDSTYYCERADATLAGKTCYYTVGSKLIGYTCPSGYSRNGETCYRNTSESVNPIWGNAEIIYSTSPYLEGYQRTGVIQYTERCHLIEEIHYK